MIVKYLHPLDPSWKTIEEELRKPERERFPFHTFVIVHLTKLVDKEGEYIPFRICKN